MGQVIPHVLQAVLLVLVLDVLGRARKRTIGILLEDRLRVFSRATKHEGTKILVPVAFRRLRFGDHPTPQPL